MDRLQVIEDGIKDIDECDTNALVKVIDEFQQDPSALSGRLSGLIKLMTSGFFELPIEGQLRVSTVFYNLSKVCSQKRTCVQLPSDVYLLDQILCAINNSHTLLPNENNWHYLYLLFSWLQLLAMSPLILQGDTALLTFVTQFQSQNQHFLTLLPIIARIKAELIVKNGSLMDQYCKDLEISKNNISYNDLLTIYNVLKIINKSNIHFEKYAKHEDLVNIVSVISIHQSKQLLVSERSAILLTKIFPKLARMFLYNRDWEKIEDLISWYLNNLDSRFSEVRFALANSYRKIIDILLQKVEAEDILPDLLQTRIREVIVMFNNQSWDNIDTDKLHTLLLIIAFNMNTINSELPSLINDIILKIIPQASRFQQKRLNVISGKQIRDASNFICWSLSRCQNVDPEMISPIVLHLLISSLFDHDFLIRKSANAALQEALGRKGSKILNNHAILELIQLPIFDLKISFSDNLHKLYSIFSVEYPQFFHFILNWLLNFGILENLQMENVVVAITALMNITTTYPAQILDNFSCKERLLEIVSSRNSMTKIQQSKLLYLLLKLDLNSLSDTILLLQRLLCQILLDSFKKKPSYDEHFIFLTMFEFWTYQLSKNNNYCFSTNDCRLFFHILRSTNTDFFGFDVINEKCNFIISNLSKNSGFDSNVTMEYFWNEFTKFLRLNNHFINSSLPFIRSEKFLHIFNQVLPHLTCSSKSAILDSLDGNLQEMLEEDDKDNLLTLLTHFLDDYTITEQGDVGRLVRYSALNLIINNFELFLSLEKIIITNTLSSIIRLVAEPAPQIRETAFSFLAKYYQIEAHIDFNGKHEQNILKLQEVIPNEMTPSFWWGYILSGGAIYSTDQQLVDSLDSFLNYFDQQSIETRLELCNKIVRVIPSSKEILDIKNNKHKNDQVGIIRYDMIKFTISALNFWRRLLESNLAIPESFNFQGFYAKIYNLHLIPFNNNLKSSSIKLFPLLCTSFQKSKDDGSHEFSNIVLKRLIFLLKKDIKEADSKRRFKKLCLECILQILISSQAHKQLKFLQNTEEIDSNLLALSENELLI